MRYIAQVGVEDLRVDITTLGGEDENHAWTAVSFQGAIDSWARGVALHFGSAGFDAAGATRITFTQNYAVSPDGKKGGKYTFPGPNGSYELRGAGLAPASLYEAQLCERLRK